MRAEAAETVRPAMPRVSRAGRRVMPAPSAPTPASLKTAAKPSTRSAICALPPTSAPCEPVTTIRPASSGAISEAESAAGVREGGRSDAQRLRHGDDGDAGLVPADARIVVDDGAGVHLEREIRRIAPAVRAGDDHAAAGIGPELGGRVGEHDVFRQVGLRHVRSYARPWVSDPPGQIP